MNVGAVSAVSGGVGSVYATYSPYLNGVVRTSDAAAAAALQASAASSSAAATAVAVAARADAAAAVTAAPPFLNPAITEIADQTALGQTLQSQGAVTPASLLSSQDITTQNVTPTPASAAATAAQAQTSPTNSVLYGDSGTLIQSYGAVALATSPLAIPALYGLPTTPAISAVAPVALTRIPRIDSTG